MWTHVRLQVLQAGQSFTAEVTDKRLPTAVIPAVTPRRPVDAVLISPPVPSDESVLSLRHVFPHGKLQLVRGKRRHLLAVLITCRLLPLCCRRSHLADGERGACAGVQHVRAAGVLTQRILGTEGAMLERRLVHQMVVTARLRPLDGVQAFLDGHGGGADFPAHPRLTRTRTDAFVCYSSCLVGGSGASASVVCPSTAQPKSSGGKEKKNVKD